MPSSRSPNIIFRHLLPLNLLQSTPQRPPHLHPLKYNDPKLSTPKIQLQNLKLQPNFHQPQKLQNQFCLHTKTQSLNIMFKPLLLHLQPKHWEIELWEIYEFFSYHLQIQLIIVLPGLLQLFPNFHKYWKEFLQEICIKQTPYG